MLYRIFFKYLNHANEWRAGTNINHLASHTALNCVHQVSNKQKFNLINYIFTSGVDEGVYHSVNLQFCL